LSSEPILRPNPEKVHTASIYSREKKGQLFKVQANPDICVSSLKEKQARVKTWEADVTDK